MHPLWEGEKKQKSSNFREAIKIQESEIYSDGRRQARYKMDKVLTGWKTKETHQENMSNTH